MPVKYLLRIMLVGFSPCEIYVVITTKNKQQQLQLRNEVATAVFLCLTYHRGLALLIADKISVWKYGVH